MSETRASGTVLARTAGPNTGSLSVHRGGVVPYGFRVSSANRVGGIVSRSKNRPRDIGRALPRSATRTG